MFGVLTDLEGVSEDLAPESFSFAGSDFDFPFDREADWLSVE